MLYFTQIWYYYVFSWSRVAYMEGMEEEKTSLIVPVRRVEPYSYHYKKEKH